MPLTRKRLLTLFLEVLVGLGMVAAVILYAEFGPFSWMPSARGWLVACLTALLFGGAIKEYRREWRRPQFWLCVAGLLSVHVGTWVTVLLRTPDFPFLGFVPFFVAEAAGLVWLLHRIGFHVAAGPD